jgi:8-oxo-dGTP pyrophosphatase MutT (NUDIX family)
VSYTVLDKKSDEIWDVYDKDGNKTGRVHERSRLMAAGDYHLVVHVWKRNRRGEWLIDKRAARDSDDLGGKWETTGGSALAGEDSLTAALREAREELGLELDPAKGTLFRRHLFRNDFDAHTCFVDVWVFEHECHVSEVRLQESETFAVMWATSDKICGMIAMGEFLDGRIYPYFDEMMEDG